MGSRYLLDLADVCRRTGYGVIEIGAGRSQTGDSWKYRARGSGGYSSGLPNHIIVHHTASGPHADGWPDANYCAFGNAVRPVGNLYLSRKAEIYVTAGGAANTNGTGRDPCGVTPNDSMNSQSIAIEAANNGVGETWPDQMLDCYVKLVRCLSDAYGIPVSRVHSHFEWAPGRKIDPAGPTKYATGAAMWNMDQFRNDVAGTAQPKPPDPEKPPTKPPTTTGVFSVNGYRKDVRQGSQGKMAKMCQQQINLIAGQGIAEDGNFGPQSVGALKNVQTVLGVPVDGWCGQQTWQAFENGIKTQAESGNWG